MPYRLPRYVSYRGHGATTISAPVTITGAHFLCFALPSNGDMVQKLLDQSLNLVTRDIQYHVLGGYVFLVVAINDKVQSPDNIGWEPDKEVGFFVPVVEERPPSPIPEKLALWVPYLLIDSIIGMTTGREIWGYNKSFMTHWAPTSTGGLEIGTEVFPTLNSGQRAKDRPLLTISPWPNVSNLTNGPWSTAADMLADIINKSTGWQLAWSALQTAGYAGLNLQPELPIPVINLKQFRDAEQTHRSCLTQLVECYCQVDSGFDGGPLDGQTYSVKIGSFQSHQIAQDMGLSLQNNSVDAAFAFWVNVNWTVPPGRIIYSSV
jgi:hypothetical protein